MRCVSPSSISSTSPGGGICIGSGPCGGASMPGRPPMHSIGGSETELGSAAGATGPRLKSESDCGAKLPATENPLGDEGEVADAVLGPPAAPGLAAPETADAVGDWDAVVDDALDDDDEDEAAAADEAWASIAV
jgi:hypothetical protein